ncbi:MAG: hypothetical protein AAFU85_05790 [Planctomycetota bacterium]
MTSVELKKLRDQRLPTATLGGSLSPDCDSVAAACMDGVYRLELESGAKERLHSHQSYASSAHWLSDGTILSGGYDGQLRWFDVNSKQLLRNQKLHDFWSWQTAVSPDGELFASVTGQYLAGGYKYEPAPQREPSVCVGSIKTGEIIHRLPHVPSVQSVAFSPDGQFVAAGNLMGEVRVYDVRVGEMANRFTTPDFTSWGIIKSHCYLGGIFALRFTPNGDELLLAGMGPMRDPMAGNGRQLWQKWKWDLPTPQLTDQTHEGESGEGLMEALALHPSGKFFAMGGRLRGGEWNVAVFSLERGDRLATLKTGYRATTLQFTPDGRSLVVMGTHNQSSKIKDGKFGDFGHLEEYSVAIT